MYSLSVKNKYGATLQLSGNTAYDVLSITGLTPAGATINTDIVAAADGERFNSARVNTRNIVITLGYRLHVEDKRIALYQFFKPKQPVVLHYTNTHRDVYIEGYVETFEGNIFQRGQKAQISILCPQPYFKAIDDVVTEFASINSALEFPVEFQEAGIPFSTIDSYLEKDIINYGDAESGAIIKLNARGSVTNPSIYNLTTGEQFAVNISLTTGDEITINTNSGQKRITLKSGGVTTNIINSVARGSSWFTLVAGDNIFSYTADSGLINLDVTFYTTPLYEGV